jgi:glyoxylase-like metal-dependent hydrolase (beta-lactamase superfamily II)
MAIGQFTCHQLFECETSSFTYVLAHAATRSALIIDPVFETIARDLQLLRELELDLQHILETHLHADHISGAAALRAATRARVAVCGASRIRCADTYLDDGARLRLGAAEIVCLATPGHTPGCLSYYTEGMVFTGDCLLIGGTGRTDLPGGDAATLYDSIQSRLWSLPPQTRVYPAHDYRGHLCSTIGHEKRFNPRVGANSTREAFIRLMSDSKRPPPAKMPRAIPANLSCGLVPGDADSVGAASIT